MHVLMSLLPHSTLNNTLVVVRKIINHLLFKSSKFNVQLIFLGIAQVRGLGLIAPLNDKSRVLVAYVLVETVNIVIVDHFVHHVKLDSSIAQLGNKIGSAHFSGEKNSAIVGCVGGTCVDIDEDKC